MSNKANPWGVSLNKLSFRESQPQPQSPAQNEIGVVRPTRPPSVRQRPPVRQISLKKAVKDSPKASSQSFFAKASASTSAAATKQPTPSPADMDALKSNERAARAKKRKLRQQLSMAKMNMSVLKARLGLEHMKSPPATAEETSSDKFLPHMLDAHSRSASVSTESLFATIESMGGFEQDIQAAIDKVEDLVKQVNHPPASSSSASATAARATEQLRKENEQLKVQITALQKKHQSMHDENAALKTKMETAAAKKQTAPATTAAAEYKPDPMEKYSKLKDLGQSVDKIVARMTKDGVDPAKINDWKGKNTSQSADQLLASRVNAKELQYAKYDKMRKMGMSDDTVRNKMKMDGFKPDEVERYLNAGKGGGGGAAAAGQKTGADGDNDAFNTKMAKYTKMKKLLPEHALRNKMTQDGVSKEEQNRFFDPDGYANSQKKQGQEGEAESKPNPKLEKYLKMKKMGFPVNAIVNRMRMDPQVSTDDIAEFENPGSTKKSGADQQKKKNVKASDPRLAKYERMKNMGMPTHAIVNKMRLDGMEQSLIHRFENPNDDEEDDEDDDDGDPNDEANQGLDLNIPALKKYHTMKKMGMPVHAIINKMKLDGIDATLVNAFENPAGAAAAAATKKKKGGIGSIFHKKKSSIPPKEKVKPEVDMKRFHWQTVEYKAARNPACIWRTMDEKNVTAAMDRGEFETLFSIPKKENKLMSMLKGGKDKKAAGGKKEEVKFVSAKRQYNVELLLKRLKFDGAVLAGDIVVMNEEKLGLEMLIKISDMVPSDEEQMQAKGNSNNGDAARVAKYGVVEKFFYGLSDIWSVQERIKLWIFKKEFAEICQHQTDKISLLNQALTDIQGSEALYEVFKIILAFGNYMNGGKRNGQAYGFSLETLRMLSGTKGNDGQTTLLMYIYKYCKALGSDDQKEDGAKVSQAAVNVIQELEHVSTAVKIDMDALDKKIRELKTEMDKLPQRIEEFAKNTKSVKNDVFAARMKEWLNGPAKLAMKELQSGFKEVDERGIALASTYAYQMESGQLNEFLKIFHDFITDWSKAKIKYTRLEEKRKKDELTKKKKEEAQKKLERKLQQRTVTKTQLEKKRIIKDESKLQKEKADREKLKLTMGAHIRKRTAMMAHFGNVLDEEEEGEVPEVPPVSAAGAPSNPYKAYLTSYQNGRNGAGAQRAASPNRGKVFDLDMFSADSSSSDVMQRQQTGTSVASNDTVEIMGRNSLTLGSAHEQHNRSVTALEHFDNGAVSPLVAAGDEEDDDEEEENVNVDKSVSMPHGMRITASAAIPALATVKSTGNLSGKSKKQKAQNNKNSQSQHKYRGHGGNTPTSKFDYATTTGLFIRNKPVPTATQFGNVWELNFAPMSRTAHSSARKNAGNSSPKKGNSSHIRRETRLKMAFDQMKNLDFDDDNVAPKTPTTPNASDVNDAKQLYSKYKKNRKQ